MNISTHAREAAWWYYQNESPSNSVRVPEVCQRAIDAAQAENAAEIARLKEQDSYHYGQYLSANGRAERLQELVYELRDYDTRKSKERELLKSELASVRACFSEASQNAGPAFVAHADLRKTQERVRELEEALQRIAIMPVYDQDTPVRVRHHARKALNRNEVKSCPQETTCQNDSTGSDPAPQKSEPSTEAGKRAGVFKAVSQAVTAEQNPLGAIKERDARIAELTTEVEKYKNAAFQMHDDELVHSLRAEVERMTKERDYAITEANRRDAKWMKGLDEIFGPNDWNRPISDPTPNTPERKWSHLKADRDRLAAELETAKHSAIAFERKFNETCHDISSLRDQLAAAKRANKTHVEAALQEGYIGGYEDGRMGRQTRLDVIWHASNARRKLESL